MKTRILMLAVLALSACRGWETEERPIHLIKNMDTQEKGKAYRRDSTGLFASGRTSQLPVEGTVAQGQLGDDDLWELGTDDKGEPSKEFPRSLKDGNSFAAGIVERGENRYAIYCTPCHGQNLDGKGIVAGPALDGGPRLTVPPADLHADRVCMDMVVGKVYAAIRNGVNAGNMPSYAAQIPVADRWAIVAYVKSMQMKKNDKVPMEPGGVVVDPNAGISADTGAALFKAKGCNACHSLDGSKLVGPSFKGLWGRQEETSAGAVTVDDAYFKESLLQPMAKIVKDYPPAMPPQQVTEDDIKSLALFIQTLK